MAAASELFYTERATTVGIERVLEHAGVAKATLYSAFLARKGWSGRICGPATRPAANAWPASSKPATRPRRNDCSGSSRCKGLSFTDPGFRGCAFLSANAQAPLA